MDDAPFEPARTVALLSGGDSPEREVSLASGDQAELALCQSGYDCQRFDPAEIAIEAIEWASFDVCFIALHGGAGEDGRVQEQLDRLHVPYTGSGPKAAAMAMNKTAAKNRFFELRVPTLPFASFVSRDASPNIDVKLSKQLERLGYPLVIKPQSQGSSLGIAVANSEMELRRAIHVAAEFDDTIMAEPYVSGREFTIALLDRRTLPLIEVIVPQPIFSYDAKYSSSATQYRFDAPLPLETGKQLNATAVDAAAALGAAGLSRVDMLLDNRGRVWVLEVNTIPGLTDHSLAPRAAAAVGMEMPTLVDWMVRDAVRRHRFALALSEAP